MPIFMDRHDVSDSVTAEMIAELHSQDLKIQDQYNCKGMTYWFDDIRKTAFCLIEAPEKQCIVDMHKNAHGEIPHQVIEVDPAIVESFLGRIEDPEKSQNTKLNIINEPAFRTLVSINSSFTIDLKSIKIANGEIVEQNGASILVSFKSVTKAVQFSANLIQVAPNKIKIGIAAGVPVGNGLQLFDETIRLVKSLNYVIGKNLILTKNVFNLYKSENQNKFSYNDLVLVLNEIQEQFLGDLICKLENSWTDPELTPEDFYTDLKRSKSSFYRELKRLTGTSLNSFIKNFRLSKANTQLEQTSKTISEIAFDNGFNSASYFSKCFEKRYGKRPSRY